MSILNDFLSFYVQLLVGTLLSNIAIIKSFPLKVSKKKAYILAIICANILPIADSLSIVIVGERIIAYTSSVYWILKVFNFLPQLGVIAFLLMVIDVEWYKCYWLSILLQFFTLLPAALTYQVKFIDQTNEVYVFRAVDSSSIFEYILYLMINLAVGLICVFISRYTIKKLKLNKISKWIWYIMYIVWAFSIYSSDKNYGTIEGSDFKNTIANFNNIVMFLLILFILMFVTINIFDKKVLKLENNLLKQQNEIQYESYLSMEKQEAEIHKLYHDIGNHIETIKVLLNDGESEEVKKYTAALSDKYQRIREEYYCKNKIINAVLLQKGQACKANNITFGYELQIPEHLPIKDIDLMSVFANLLDNAIEGCLRNTMSSNYINLTVKAIGDYFVVKTVNSKPVEANTKNHVLVTWKKDKKYHGYGVKIMKEIVERYDGKSEFKHQEREFSSMIMLMMK